MRDLVTITKDTCIGSEFLGIYNDNNNTIKSSVTSLETNMENLLEENRALRERLSQLSGNYQSLKNSYDALNQNYRDLFSAFETINNKLDDIINQE